MSKDVRKRQKLTCGIDLDQCINRSRVCVSSTSIRVSPVSQASPVGGTPLFIYLFSGEPFMLCRHRLTKLLSRNQKEIYATVMQSTRQWDALGSKLVAGTGTL